MRALLLTLAAALALAAAANAQIDANGRTTGEETNGGATADAGNMTAAEFTLPEANVTNVTIEVVAGDMVCWRVEGSGVLERTTVRWGTTSQAGEGANATGGMDANATGNATGATGDLGANDTAAPQEALGPAEGTDPYAYPTTGAVGGAGAAGEAGGEEPQEALGPAEGSDPYAPPTDPAGGAGATAGVNDTEEPQEALGPEEGTGAAAGGESLPSGVQEAPRSGYALPGSFCARVQGAANETVYVVAMAGDLASAEVPVTLPEPRVFPPGEDANETAAAGAAGEAEAGGDAGVDAGGTGAETGDGGGAAGAVAATDDGGNV